MLDFGAQYSQLIVRRVREAQVYCELLPFDAPVEQVMALRPRGVILSGGPNSVYEAGAPQLPSWVDRERVAGAGILPAMEGGARARRAGGRPRTASMARRRSR
ncbi:MAG: hypothetical protein U0232_17015 [Thermomicrobiales bacterium]